MLNAVTAQRLRGDPGGQGWPKQEAQWERDCRLGRPAGATQQGASGEGMDLEQALQATRGQEEARAAKGLVWAAEHSGRR